MTNESGRDRDPRPGVRLESAPRSPVVAAVLVDAYGHVLANACLRQADLTLPGAIAGEMLRQWALIGTDLGRGAVRSIMIERAGGPATITPVGGRAALLVLGTRACRLGLLRLETWRARTALGAWESVALPAESGPLSAPPPPSPPQSVEKNLEVPASRPISGEVILNGAHPFRLVTKLVSRLMQTKGVRSSRLRAHSPTSTIIDVVLEDSATLTTIDAGVLEEEFPVERAGRRGNRLILRALKSATIPANWIADRP